MTAVPVAPPHPDVRWYAITHITDYHYSAPVTSSYGRGHLFPRTTATQRCLDATVTVSPTPTDASSGVDVQGNETVFFHVTTPHEHLRVTARSLVAVTAPDPALRATGAAAAPWEQSRPGGRPDAALDVEFALDLDPPEITADVREYAAKLNDRAFSVPGEAGGSGSPRSGETQGTSSEGVLTEAERGMREMSAKFAEVGKQLYVSENGKRRAAID